jgi:hypothetical protein
MIDLKITVSVAPGATAPPPHPPRRVPLWRHKDDIEVDGKVRGCAPCPAVWPLSDHKVFATKQWQFYIRATNAGRSVQHVAALFGPALAFTNRNVRDIRRDWLRLLNLDRPDPDFDRVRTCSRSALTGTPGFSLLESVRLVGVSLLKRDFAALQHSFVSFSSANVLTLTMMDGSKDPLLKPGRSYPERVEDIRLEDYLYAPETHRELFMVATITNAQGQTVPFPNGVRYSWTGDDLPYTFLPHVSRRPIQYSLANLVPVPAGARIPSPYNP